MFHPVSGPLQPGIRFFQHPIPARQQHALRLACPSGRRDWVPTFHPVDPMDDLGASFTPRGYDDSVQAVSRPVSCPLAANIGKRPKTY